MKRRAIHMKWLLPLISCGLLLVSLGSSAAVNSWTLLAEHSESFSYSGAIAVHPGDSSTVYVAASRNSPFETYIRKSTDGGMTWSTVFSTQNRVFAVAIDPQSPSTVYAATSGIVNSGGALYKSFDAGQSWAVQNFGLVMEGLLSELIGPGVVVDPATPSTLYATARGGIFRSIDGATSWSLLSAGAARALAIDPSSSAILYRDIQTSSGNGVARSADGGTTWTSAVFLPSQPTGAVVTSIVIDPSHPSTVFAGTGLGVYKSTDGGATWIASSAGIPVDFFSRHINGLVVIPGSTGSTLFAATACSVYRSLDSALTWQRAGAGLSFCPVILAIASGASQPNVLYASTSEGFFGYTHDATLLAPTCYLSADPAIVAEGASSTLTSYCSPAATSYMWSPNTGFGPSDSGGVVFPSRTTTYTVEGFNANGGSNVASVTVRAPDPRLFAISTRGQVFTGDDVMIAGFAIGGPESKTVVVNARGPSLGQQGVAGALANPTLRVQGTDPGFSGPGLNFMNDNWGDTADAATIQSLGLAPPHELESSLLLTLPPGLYTAIVSGVSNATGIGIVEVFEVDAPHVPLSAISTRGLVLTGNDVLIGGFVIEGSAPQTVVLRARGPSLPGVANPLANPMLQLYQGGNLVRSNDDWMTATNAAEVQSRGLAPANTLESAILITLPPGAYTAIVSGSGGGTGVGIVEVFAQ